MLAPTLRAARYAGDDRLLQALMADELIGAQLQTAARAVQHAEIRMELLAGSVRVDARLVPTVHEAFGRVAERVQMDRPMEAYVFDAPSVNAWVAEGRDRLFVGLSSAAVNTLGEPELEFVIGHELGHTFYGHTAMPAGRLATELPDPRRRMQLMAWSRAAEISADRAGLLACGSLDVAARAMFQALSGLRLDGVSITPADFAGQWDLLAGEVIDAGGTPHWQLTHPFLHLRMKALILFAEAMPPPGTPWPAAAAGPLRAADDQVERMLAVMDPLARETPDAADPLLAEFFLWGGLYVALTHGELTAAERERLASVTSMARMEDALRDGMPDADACLGRFRDAIARRRQRLSAAEIFRIMEGLAEVAKCDARFAEPEQDALRRVAATLGVSADLIIAKHLA
jgi:Zn-dependent protease with chaperone function/uncharacterized tellurite resistance protein B-like protein